MQYFMLELFFEIKGIKDDDFWLVFILYYYDGIMFMIKYWNSMWNVDVLGVLCGRYLYFVFVIKIGEIVICNCLCD